MEAEPERRVTRGILRSCGGRILPLPRSADCVADQPQQLRNEPTQVYPYALVPIHMLRLAEDDTAALRSIALLKLRVICSSYARGSFNQTLVVVRPDCVRAAPGLCSAR